MEAITSQTENFQYEAMECEKNCSTEKEEFSDTTNIVPPASLEDLINELHKIFANDDVNVEYVQKLMASYASKPREWKKFAKFDQHKYTRNLVDEGNGKFNLMILCWNEAQGSSIHSHADSHCFLKVLDGAVREELFDWPGESDSEVAMTKTRVNMYGKDECAYINDDLGLHRVENSSHANKAITLHLYSPPFDECKCFDERTGHACPSKVTFWTKFGKRTPFFQPVLHGWCNKGCGQNTRKQLER